MNIDEIYRDVQALANKDQRGNISPAQFNLFAWRASWEWYLSIYGNPQEYQPGNPMPKKAWQETQKITDDLRIFLKPATIFVSNGQLAYPDGSTVKDINGNILPPYVHFSSGIYRYRKVIGSGLSTYVTVQKKPIRVVQDEKLASYLDSVIVNPTEQRPIMVFYDNYMQFYPETLKQVDIVYLREPAKPNWAYTLVNNRPVYDAVNSVDIEAPEEAYNNIITRILAYVGINLREGELEQYAQLEKQQGT